MFIDEAVEYRKDLRYRTRNLRLTKQRIKKHGLPHLGGARLSSLSLSQHELDELTLNLKGHSDVDLHRHDHQQGGENLDHDFGGWTHNTDWSAHTTDHNHAHMHVDVHNFSGSDFLL